MDRDRSEAFNRTFAEDFAAIHGFIQRRLGVRLADDLTAETFAIAYRRWAKLDLSRPVRPWLYGIATNIIRRHRRDEERKLRAYARSGVDPALDAPDEDDAIERVAAAAQQRELAQALADLPHDQREVLLLHAWAELSDVEISAALSLPIGTVKSRLSRARRRLRNQLRPDGQ